MDSAASHDRHHQATRGARRHEESLLTSSASTTRTSDPGHPSRPHTRQAGPRLRCFRGGCRLRWQLARERRRRLRLPSERRALHQARQHLFSCGPPARQERPRRRRRLPSCAGAVVAFHASVCQQPERPVLPLVRAKRGLAAHGVPPAQQGRGLHGRACRVRQHLGQPERLVAALPRSTVACTRLLRSFVDQHEAGRAVSRGTALRDTAFGVVGRAPLRQERER